MSDVVLAVGVGMLTVVMGYMGVRVTLRPPQTERAKWTWEIGFAVVALLTCILIGWQTKRSVKAQDALQSQLRDIRNNEVKPPSAQENAQAILALQDKQKETQKESVASAKPSPKPRPVVAPKPPEQPTQSPVVTPPQAAQLTITQSPDVSSRSDAPYLIRVVVQSNVVFPSLKLAIECDGPIVEGHGGYAGAFMMTSQGVVNGHPNIFVFTYQSAMPPFGPANPITLNFWSKQPIACTKAQTF